MRAISFLATLALAFPALGDTVVFRDVNVIAMTSPAVAERRTVVVHDGRIASVAKNAKAPRGAKVVDGSGKFLVPGVAEMHGHVPPVNAANDATADALFLYVANGITTVRGMLGHPGQLSLREKAKRGEIVSPNLYLAGPSFNGNSIHSPQEAIEMGQETFDHIDGYVEYLEGDKGPVDEKKLADIVARTKAAGAWIVPTSALWEVLYNTIPLETLKSYEELKYVPLAGVAIWSNAYTQRAQQIQPEAAKNTIENRVRILRALHEGGVRILMGTDAPQQFSVPGFSLHRELLRMREAGMSPYEILKSGTVNVGSYFAAQDSFGTIEPGKRADLILLDANPLTDITNLAKIDGVMVRGRWLSRADLDAGLAKIAEKHKR